MPIAAPLRCARLLLLLLLALPWSGCYGLSGFGRGAGPEDVLPVTTAVWERALQTSHLPEPPPPAGRKAPPRSERGPGRFERPWAVPLVALGTPISLTIDAGYCAMLGAVAVPVLVFVGAFDLLLALGAFDR